MKRPKLVAWLKVVAPNSYLRSKDLLEIFGYADMHGITTAVSTGE